MPKTRKASKWVSFSEISRDLGCSRLTVSLRVADGAIPGGTTFLGRVRVDRKTYVKWRRSQPI